MDEKFRSACAFAREEIKHLSRIDQIGLGRTQTLLWSDLGLVARSGEPLCVDIPPEADSKLCVAARQDCDAFALLKLAAGSRLRNGLPLPREISELIGQIILGTFEEPRKKPARSDKDFWRRDFMVRVVADRIGEMCDLPTINGRVTTKSKAEVIHHVFRELGMNPPGMSRIMNIIADQDARKVDCKTKGLLYQSYFDDETNDPHPD